MKVKKSESRSVLSLCDSMDYTVHGILQARILEWVATPSSRGSSQPRDWTQVSRIAGGSFTGTEWVHPCKILSTVPGTQQMFTKHWLFLIIHLALSECFPGPSQLQQPEQRTQLGTQPKCEISTLSWLSIKNKYLLSIFMSQAVN